MKSRLLALALLLMGGCPSWFDDSGITFCPTGIMCPPGKSCAKNQQACIVGNCGNGTLDPGEVCDDGNVADGDGCSHDCKSKETCGNDIIDTAVGETCDPPNPGQGCSVTCKLEGCGNGVVDPGEDCDNGPSGAYNQTKESAQCNADCTTARHGDGKVNAALREQCDGTNGYDCASPTCNPDCTPSACGDGKLNTLAREECDDGAENSTSGACLPASAGTLACKRNTCGDGFKNVGKEDCDDGPQSNTVPDGCPYGEKTCILCSMCKLKPFTGPYCGDHVQNGNEACDDGPNNGSTTCAYGQRTCQICNATCTGKVPATGPYCGDGHPDNGEACDDGENNGATSCPYGTPSCLICNATCTRKMPRTGPYCGDHIQSNGEVCDDGPDNGKTSCDGRYGQQTCTVCSADCKSTKEYKEAHCGDGFQNGPPKTEDCDDPSSFACGTCGKQGTANQCKRVGPASSTGSITIASPSRLTGVTIQLDDGVSPGGPKTLEFVNGGQAHPGNVAVDLSSGAGTADAAAIAQRLVTAITALNTVSSFTIVATAPLDSATVSMANSAAGLFGNHQIVVKPGNTSAITTTGMVGGNGCPLGQMCASDYDCAQGSCSGDTPHICAGQ